MAFRVRKKFHFGQHSCSLVNYDQFTESHLFNRPFVWPELNQLGQATEPLISQSFRVSKSLHRSAEMRSMEIYSHTIG